MAELSLLECARAAGMSKRQLHSLLKQGKLTARLVKGPWGVEQWMVDTASLDAYLNRPRREHHFTPPPAQHEDLLAQIRQIVREELERALKPPSFTELSPEEIARRQAALKAVYGADYEFFFGGSTNPPR